MKTLLICTDFSESALHAAKYALMLARQYKFEYVTLFHAYQEFVHTTTLPSISEYDTNEPARASMTELNELKSQLEEWTDNDIQIRIRTEELVLGENINEISKEENSDLIVMGITGKSTFEKVFVGSNTVNVSQNSHQPVLIVPANAPIKPIKSILVACEACQIPQSTLPDSLSELLELFNVPVTILSVDDKNSHFSTPTPDKMYGMHYIFGKYQPQYVFINHEDKAGAILDYAANNMISLIIALPKNYSFFQSLFHKSTSKKLIYQSDIPLLTLHQ